MIILCERRVSQLNWYVVKRVVNQHVRHFIDSLY